MQFADNKLEEKYPDFKALMKEYHDGILLFDLTDRNVWTKAIKDTTGLKDYYQKNTINYLWGERMDATIFTFKESKIKAEDALKFVEKINKKQYGSDFTRINEQIKKLSKDTTTVTYVHDKFSKGDNKVIDQIKWQQGIAETIKDGANIIIVLVNKILMPEQKTLTEAKGIVTADYQNYLEKEWLKTLRTKYPYTVNQEVYNSIK
jgi:peptidyl-prolyl cis-trans isomerase SurA